MLQPITISSRELSREYKKVFQRIKATKRPVIVTANKHPQVAIVHLDEFPGISSGNNSTEKLLEWSQEIRKLLNDANLPSDLSEKHDYYLWEEN